MLPRLSLRSSLFAFTAAVVSIVLSETAGGSQLAIKPDILNFGGVVLGTTETLLVNLGNSGSMRVTVSTITSSYASYTVEHPTLPVTLSPGASMAIKVAFKPEKIGYVTGAITINGGSASLKVVGGGQSSNTLYATPGSIMFGSVPAGSSATSSAAIKNGEKRPVTIAQAVITGSGFSVAGLSLPLTLSPGQSFTFKIVFSPKSSGSVWGTFGARNSAGTGLLGIPLFGSATAPARSLWRSFNPEL